MNRDDQCQLSGLGALSRRQLLLLWQRTYGKPAPVGMRREILIPFLAYKLQENAYGGLEPATHAELRRIARALERNSASSELCARPKLKSGTRLFRRWRGEMHEVFVTERGYEHRGVGYRSLSEIARHITGTRWSGPAFFGLQKSKSLQGRSDG